MLLAGGELASVRNPSSLPTKRIVPVVRSLWITPIRPSDRPRAARAAAARADGATAEPDLRVSSVSGRKPARSRWGARATAPAGALSASDASENIAISVKAVARRARAPRGVWNAIGEPPLDSRSPG